MPFYPLTNLKYKNVIKMNSDLIYLFYQHVQHVNMTGNM